MSLNCHYFVHKESLCTNTLSLMSLSLLNSFENKKRGSIDSILYIKKWSKLSDNSDNRRYINVSFGQNSDTRQIKHGQ